MEDFTVRMEGLHLRSKNFTLRTEGVQLRSKNFPLRAEGVHLRSKDFTLRTEVSAQRGLLAAQGGSNFFGTTKRAPSH